MTIYSLYRVILPFFRRRRFRQFNRAFKPTANSTILDVGGFPADWPPERCSAKLTILNLRFHDYDYKGPHKLIKGDGCDLKFPDRCFDISYSNSVIEHLYNFENQEKFAAEIRRVGRGVWVQTPARWFIVEPHLITPVIHYLPKSWQRRLLRYFTIWGIMTKPNKAEVEEFLKEVRLLTLKEMKVLFPDCHILRERFLGMTKSYIAIRNDTSL
jgi:hypothetical protein